MEYEDIIKKLKSLSNCKAIAGMARYGIIPENTYGVSIPNLRKMAKEIGINHIKRYKRGYQACKKNEVEKYDRMDCPKCSWGFKKDVWLRFEKIECIFLFFFFNSYQLPLFF